MCAAVLTFRPFLRLPASKIRRTIEVALCDSDLPIAVDASAIACEVGKGNITRLKITLA